MSPAALRGAAGAPCSRSGEAAALVAFGEGTSARLAWQLDLRAGPAAHYAAVVDAASGRILYRANRVKSAANDALVWEQYPGAANGGTAHTADLTPYLFAGRDRPLGPLRARLVGPQRQRPPEHRARRAHRAARRAGRGRGGRPQRRQLRLPLQRLHARATPPGACDAAHKCSWDHAVAESWQDNREQNAVQAFYYVNRFRDHLLAAPISFGPSDGNFDDGDRILVNTDDGAAERPRRRPP